MPSIDLASFILGKTLAERVGLSPSDANSWGALQMQLGWSVTGVLVVQELIRRDAAVLEAARQADPVPAQTERLIIAAKRAKRAATRATKAANAAHLAASTVIDAASRTTEATVEAAKQITDAAEKIIQAVHTIAPTPPPKPRRTTTKRE